MKTEIHWQQAQVLQEHQKQAELLNQEQKLNEFLTSSCDMFTYADWQYYEAETGKSIEWLKENATYRDEDGAYGTMLQNAIDFGDTDMAEFFI